MNKKLHYIGQKMNAIQFGLLRYHYNEERITIHVTAKIDGENSLVCTLTGNEDLKKLRNKRVNLIQKSEDDYLYITGQVEESVEKSAKTISVRILKACWFVRKTKGALSWLQEKHTYDIYPQDKELDLAS